MKKALIFTDVQEDFLRNQLDYIQMIAQRYLDHHGKEYDLVILTYWRHEGNKGENPLLLKFNGAKVIEKTTYSAITAEVEKLLKDNGIGEVHLGGVDAEGAILATMFALVDKGIEVKVMERAIASAHGKNGAAMGIARGIVGNDNVVDYGSQRVWV